MKESDAKKKWCPQSRYVIDNPTVAYVGNRFDSGREDIKCLCLASDCMMWESWEYEKSDPSPNNDAFIVNKGEGDCGLKTKEACHEI